MLSRTIHSSGIYIVILCFLQSWYGFGQNLVKNPSFEEYVNCPKGMGNFNKDVKYWSTPTGGSTDYFNTCSTIMGAPKNFNGSQTADFGQGYAGLYMHAPDDYREYLQAELSTTLIKGERYTVSFYVSWADRSDMAIRDFGILFSGKKVELPIKKMLSGKQRYKIKGNSYNFMEIENSDFYMDKDTWVLVTTEIEAKGTENFLILGNYKNNAATRRYKMNKKIKKGAYYYVDRVSVISKNVNATPATLELDKTSVLTGVLFAFDEYELQPAALKNLQQLYGQMKSDPTLHITIHGHTDNKGSKGHNRRLSRNRAKAVGNYLVHLGLEKNRVSWKGHGGEQPVASNDTEEGRQQNRRAEFVLTKMKH